MAPEFDFKVFLEKGNYNEWVATDFWQYGLNFIDQDKAIAGIKSSIKYPRINLYCPTCAQTLFFSCNYTQFLTEYSQGLYASLVLYQCDNCEEYLKYFIINIALGDEFVIHIKKLAEHPNWQPKVPPKVMTLLADDKDNFMKGYRCENLKYGVAAFTYYRRIIESQWHSLIDEIIRVSKHIGLEDEKILELEQVKSQTQFSKAVGDLKPALPTSLLVHGENPLTLLHRAISIGIHNKSDEECLNLAADVRVILFQMVENLTMAMKEKHITADAIKRLKALK